MKDIIKIFGKTSDEFNRYLSEKTVMVTREHLTNGTKVEFYDIDRDIGLDEADKYDIKYIPTIVYINNDTEVDILENNKCINTLNMTHIWWSDLILFLRANI